MDSSTGTNHTNSYKMVRRIALFFMDQWFDNAPVAVRFVLGPRFLGKCNPGLVRQPAQVVCKTFPDNSARAP